MQLQDRQDRTPSHIYCFSSEEKNHHPRLPRQKLKKNVSIIPGYGKLSNHKIHSNESRKATRFKDVVEAPTVRVVKRKPPETPVLQAPANICFACKKLHESVGLEADLCNG